MTQNYNSIPAEMKALPNWVVHRKKMPYDPGTGRRAKSNKPDTWRSFNEAAQALPRYDGMGFMFGGSGFVGVDIDHCIDAQGTLTTAAAAIVENLDSYTEISTSGSGLHIILKGKVPGSKNKTGNFEIYDAGRYFVMTGNVYRDKPIRADQERINAFYRQYISADQAAAQGQEVATQEDTDETALLLLDLASVARQSKSGDLFIKLFDHGDTTDYPSHSEADQALMNLLPFYCHGDAEKMRQFFSLSALGKREKWQRKDYQDATIKTALKSWDGTCYDPEALKMQWPDVMTKGKSVTPVKYSRKNVEYLLQRLGVTARFNEVTKTVDFTGLYNLSFDAVVAALRQEAHRRGLGIGKQDLIDLLGLISERNKYSPVCDYLTQCRQEWDGQTDYIDRLFRLIELDETSVQDAEFCKRLLRLWLISAVRIAFNDGSFTAQGMLILEGRQGIGKTRFKYLLLPVSTWAHEMSIDPTVKDDLLKAAHYWIIELGEFRDTMRYQKIDRLKQYITQPKDAIRLPYTRDTIEFPRKTIFIGTVNGSEFLQDHTGNRRYWPIAVQNINLDDSFPRNQLWGYVMYLAFDMKERAYLTQEEIEKLDKQNDFYERKSITEQLLRDLLAWGDPPEEWRQVTATDLCEEIGLNKTQNAQVARVIRGMAARDKRIKVPTNNMEKNYTLPRRNYGDFKESEDDIL